MGISSDMGVIALVLAGVFAYVAFLLWTPKKVLSEKPNRFFSFLIGFLCSISLSLNNLEINILSPHYANIYTFTIII